MRTPCVSFRARRNRSHITFSWNLEHKVETKSLINAILNKLRWLDGHAWKGCHRRSAWSVLAPGAAFLLLFMLELYSYLNFRHNLGFLRLALIHKLSRAQNLMPVYTNTNNNYSTPGLHRNISCLPYQITDCILGTFIVWDFHWIFSFKHVNLTFRCKTIIKWN